MSDKSPEGLTETHLEVLTGMFLANRTEESSHLTGNAVKFHKLDEPDPRMNLDIDYELTQVSEKGYQR